MVHRNIVAQSLLVLYAIGSVAIAIPLLFSLGHSGDLADTTSGKILSAALSALAIAYRLAFEDHPSYPAWILLPLAVAAPILFARFYPRRPTHQLQGD